MIKNLCFLLLNTFSFRRLNVQSAREAVDALQKPPKKSRKPYLVLLQKITQGECAMHRIVVHVLFVSLSRFFLFFFFFEFSSNIYKGKFIFGIKKKSLFHFFADGSPKATTTQRIRHHFSRRPVDPLAVHHLEQFHREHPFNMMPSIRAVAKLALLSHRTDNHTEGDLIQNNIIFEWIYNLLDCSKSSGTIASLRKNLLNC